MQALLDTCTLLWLVGEQSHLSTRAKNLIVEADSIGVSSISAFEIALKHRKGRLELPLAPAEWFQKALKFHGIEEIVVSSDIAIRSVMLPPLHNDPCDRLIVATAEYHGLLILTPDPLIRAYGVAQTEW